MPDDLDTLLTRALEGDAAAKSLLIREVLGVVRVRVYRALVARARGGRDVRQEIEDIAQETMVRLFRDDGRILGTWDATRGLSVRGFVALVAEREVGQVMRSRRRSPWASDPSDAEVIERASEAAPGPDGALASRDLFDRIWGQLKAQLSPKGIEMFEALVIEERSIEDICASFSMQADAVYAWRSRLTKRAREIAKELEGETASRRSSPTQTV